MSIKPAIAILCHLIVKLGFSAIYLSSIKGFDDLAAEKKGLNADISPDLGKKAANLFSSRKEEIKDTGFHDLFEKFSTGNITSDQLKSACMQGYSFTYKNLFFEDRTLFKNLNTFCRLKVKEVFEDFNLIKDEQLLYKFKKLLESHNDKIHGNIGDSVKQGKMNIRSNEYLEGCNKGYESVYGGENTRSGKLAYRYCHKTNLLSVD